MPRQLLFCLLLLFPLGLRADVFQLNATGSSICSFYPNQQTSYGTGIQFAFSAQDKSGNPVEGNLSWFDAVTPQCSPGVNPSTGFYDIYSLAGGNIGGEWSYLGHTYTMSSTGRWTAVCESSTVSPYGYGHCAASGSVDESGYLTVTLEEQDPLSGNWESQQLAGQMRLWEQDFSLTETRFGGAAFESYNSAVNFYTGDAPEPSPLALMACAVPLLIICKRRADGGIRR